MKQNLFLILLLSIFLQLFLLPTLCGDNDAKFYVAIAIDMYIPLRLQYKPTKIDKSFYLTMLLTSFVWIHFFVYYVLYLKSYILSLL